MSQPSTAGFKGIMEDLEAFMEERNFNFDISKFSLDEDGKVLWDGRETNFKGFKDNFFDTTDNAMHEAVENAGIDLTNPAEEDMITKMQNMYKGSEAWNDRLAEKNAKNLGIQIGNKVDIEPGNPGDYAKAIDKDPDIKKANEKVEDMARKEVEKGKITWDVGKWVTSGIKLAGAIFTAEMIYHWIKAHQHAMNGCWLIDPSSGTKCKVKTLTCDSADYSNPNGGYSMCGTKYPQFQPGACLKIEKTKGVCPKGAGTLKQCKNGSCGPSCDCSYVSSCPKGWYLHCVNVSFWGAAGDMFGEAFKAAAGALGKIWRIIKLVLIIVGAVLALGFILWIIFTVVKMVEHDRKSQFGRRFTFDRGKYLSLVGGNYRI